jgi:hypothetical protein
MIRSLITLSSLLLFSLNSFGQGFFVQYFDGQDTSIQNAVIIKLDTSSSNVWQIGPPQKNIFNSAFSTPNSLMTDTINNYPINTTSSFTFGIRPFQIQGGILALQWIQQLDMDKGGDGGIIEFSVDSGRTWDNVFNNPFVYSFYGFNSSNQDTIIATGDYSFSGTDSTWRNIWLCYDISFLSFTDSLTVRFTMKSDSVNTNKEGWIIDNLLVSQTLIHTITEKKQEKYMEVSPNPTSGIVNITCKKMDSFHIIQELQLLDIKGSVLKKWQNVPTKFFVDISDQESGVYFLKITTNLKTETIKIIRE